MLLVRNILMPLEHVLFSICSIQFESNISYVHASDKAFGCFAYV